MCTVTEKLKFLGLTSLLQPFFLCFGVAKIAIWLFSHTAANDLRVRRLGETKKLYLMCSLCNPWIVSLPRPTCHSAILKREEIGDFQTRGEPFPITKWCIFSLFSTMIKLMVVTIAVDTLHFPTILVNHIQKKIDMQ